MPLMQVLSLLGAGLILLGFAQLQRGIWQAEQAAYLWANLAGALLLAVVAAAESQWGFLLLEVVWVGFSLYGLLRRTISS